MKMPLSARVAHARLLLVAARFSGEISGQPMVGSGRSKVEDSVGGGLDGRWWLTRENRRLEASVVGDDPDLFLALWGGENHRGFTLQNVRNLSVVVRRLETAEYGRSEERERVAGERREMLCDLLRCERVHGTPVPLNTVRRWIGQLWLAGSAGWSHGPDEQRFWSGVVRCIESSVHRVTWWWDHECRVSFIFIACNVHSWFIFFLVALDWTIFLPVPFFVIKGTLIFCKISPVWWFSSGFWARSPSLSKSSRVCSVSNCQCFWRWLLVNNLVLLPVARRKIPRGNRLAIYVSRCCIAWIDSLGVAT